MDPEDGGWAWVLWIEPVKVPDCQAEVNTTLDGHVGYPIGTRTEGSHKNQPERASFQVQAPHGTGPGFGGADPRNLLKCLRRERTSAWASAFRGCQWLDESRPRQVKRHFYFFPLLPALCPTLESQKQLVKGKRQHNNKKQTVQPFWACVRPELQEVEIALYLMGKNLKCILKWTF